MGGERLQEVVQEGVAAAEAQELEAKEDEKLTKRYVKHFGDVVMACAGITALAVVMNAECPAVPGLKAVAGLCRRGLCGALSCHDPHLRDCRGATDDGQDAAMGERGLDPLVKLDGRGSHGGGRRPRRAAGLLFVQ